ERFAAGRPGDPFARAETLLDAFAGQGARLPSQRRFAARAKAESEGIALTAEEMALLERLRAQGPDAVACAAPAAVPCPRPSRGPLFRGKVEAVHQYEGGFPALVGVDLRNEAAEMLRRAMRIERGAVGPLLAENERPRVLPGAEQCVGAAARLAARQF